MADKNINAFTEETSLADDDYFPMWDTSASTTDKGAVGSVRRYDVDTVTVTGSLTAISKQYIRLNSGTAIALTISGAPTIGDVIEIKRIGSGAVTHTAVLSGSVTWDGTNATASFDTDGDYIRAIAISATEWDIVTNSGVTLSA